MSSAEDEQADLGRVTALPEDVSPEAWNEEKVRFQNPRIRAFLACNQRLDRIRESNDVILHCSPARVNEIISALREVSELVRLAIEPLINVPSCIPEIESARESIAGYLAAIEKEVLGEIDRLPTQIREDRLGEVRRALCVWIGKLHAFLVDCQREILAADPRSGPEADSFPARRLPKDAEEAQWLHASVRRLCGVVERIEKEREAALVQHAGQITRAGRVLDAGQTAATTAYLAALRDVLIPRLRAVLNLKGIRISEIDLIDAHTTSILQQCAIAVELQAVGQEIQGEAEAAAIVGRRLAEVLRSINRRVRDVGSFVAVWERMIAQRRSLAVGPQKG